MKNLIKSVYKFLHPKYQKLFLEYKVDFKSRYGHGKPSHALLYERINTNRHVYHEYLKKFLLNKESICKIKKSSEEKYRSEPCWNNGFLPGLDIVTLYSLIGIFKPKLYVEIGSGNSTKVVRKAVKDFHLQTKIISIDPSPRTEIDFLADEIICKPLENINDYSFIEQLNENDILFIDNSHRSFPNSDVTVCFLEILPKLKKDVVVHIHDIYLPYDYPQFMCDRFYNEQYLLASFLLASETYFDIIMPNYFVNEDVELSSIISPMWNHKNMEGVERHGGSFWMVKNK